MIKYYDIDGNLRLYNKIMLGSYFVKMQENQTRRYCLTQTIITQPPIQTQHRWHIHGMMNE